MTIPEETRFGLENDINQLARHYSLIRNEAFSKTPPAETYPWRPRAKETKQKSTIHVNFFWDPDKTRNVKDTQKRRSFCRVV